ncbi:hypothetical protein HK100_004450 [Physocladia obscura]|uniref:Uncharacterized protein n=1 Tax=Physocladia obscura TaxID=109957 RepID=A0AAD5ST24_9FUNG|nr:hypothetical protein HK100_004450 [Physocladia obscura]
MATLQTLVINARSLLAVRQIEHNKFVITHSILGGLLAADGAVRVLRPDSSNNNSNNNSKHLKQNLAKNLRRAAITICTIWAVFFIFAQVASLPLRIIKRVVWGVAFLAERDPRTSVSFIEGILSTLNSTFWAVLVATPEAALYFIRYYYPAPMDKLFLDSLMAYTADIENTNFRLKTSKQINKIGSQFSVDQDQKKPEWSRNLFAFLHRFWYRLRILIGLWAFSFIPVVGFLAWPLATFIYVAEKVNYGAAVGLFLLSLISPAAVKYVRGPVFRQLFELRALARELVEPYLSRSKMTKEQQSAWLVKNDAVITGFTVPLFVLLWIPFVGPVVYFTLANACAARLCLEIFDQADLDNEAISPDSSNTTLDPSKLKLEFFAPVIAKKLLSTAVQADVFLEAVRNFVVQQVDQLLEVILSQVLGVKKD